MGSMAGYIAFGMARDLEEKIPCVSSDLAYPSDGRVNCAVD
jgi:hypothetical protein